MNKKSKRKFIIFITETQIKPDLVEAESAEEARRLYEEEGVGEALDYHSEHSESEVTDVQPLEDTRYK